MLHILTASHKLKSEKQTILLVEAIIQKYSCHVNNCLSDLFDLGIQRYLMFEVFTSNAITVRQANKKRKKFVPVQILYIPLKLQNEYTRHVSSSYYFLFNTFGSSVCQGSLSWVLFGTTIWLPHGQRLAKVEGTASLTQC